MIPDNRIRFSSEKIDFETDVGLSGQDHDSWPSPGEQARYDWMRIIIVGLLSNQSSYTSPSQYRDGTLWFDLNTLTLKINSESEFQSISEVIQLGETDDDEPITLQDWYGEATGQLLGAAAELTFSGQCNSAETTLIGIPSAIQDQLVTTRHKPFIFINGLLLDPRNAEFYTTTTIKLTNDAKLVQGDLFTVIIKNITSTGFHEATVIV